MADARHHPILKYLRQVLGTSPANGVSDAELLRRFLTGSDEAAFELLLWRHAAMVLHVCRQLLSEDEAAEDAFQATFLVFIRKAGSISRREALGAWLYRVAYRIALKARTQSKKHTLTPADLDRVAAPGDEEDAGQRDLRRLICEEVNRLPPKYRAPILACFFEGKTHEEAAQQLGWPRGTVAGRLARARELLRRRLLRRGVALSAGTLLTALAVCPSQAALTRLVDSFLQTARQIAAGQAVSAVVSPRCAALAEGVYKTMNMTRSKIVAVVMLLIGLGGTGATLWPAQQPKGERGRISAPSENPGVAQAPEDKKLAANEKPTPEEPAQLARNMAQSRLNLKKLTLAMHNYAEAHGGRLPAPSIMDENRKALLSWRVELLPYLEQNDLYRQFHRKEPWDSPHNKKLLSKMPAVFAPPGVKTRQPYATFYQVFVSAGEGGLRGSGGGLRGPTGGMPGGGTGRPMMGGAGGAGGPGGLGGSGFIAGYAGPGAAFVKGEMCAFPARFTDGASNSIFIIEAGNAVPWTKPEDLHYAEDEPLPELGGLFPNVIHAAFADGSVHQLTPKYDEQQLRYAITVNDGTPIDLSKIEGWVRRRNALAGDAAAQEDWKRKNDKLRREIDKMREDIQLLREEREIQQALSGEDPQTVKLREEHTQLQAEVKKLRDQIDAMNEELRRQGKTKAR